MRDKDGQELAVGDLVLYIAKDKDGHGALFEGRVIAVKDDYVVVEHGDGAYVCKYSPRLAFIESDDDAHDN